MTKEQIENFPAGKELDNFVAEALGWKRDNDSPNGNIVWVDENGDARLTGLSWNPSGNLVDRDVVINEMAKTYHWRIRSPFQSGENWIAGITPHGCSGFNGRPDYQASGESMALAVCRAALMMKFNYMTE